MELNFYLVYGRLDKKCEKNMVSTFISVDVTSHNFGYPLTTGTAPPSREDT